MAIVKEKMKEVKNLPTYADNLSPHCEVEHLVILKAKDPKYHFTNIPFNVYPLQFDPTMWGF